MFLNFDFLFEICLTDHLSRNSVTFVFWLGKSRYRPYAKMAALYYSFAHIQNSLTNLVFETKILKNLLSRARLDPMPKMAALKLLFCSYSK